MDKLPVELLQQVVNFLDRDAQKTFSLVNKGAWDAATTAIWRDVKLIDTKSTHLVPEEERDHWNQDTWLGRDEHDDTPIIRKLLVLAQNKSIAAKVKILTHRCHLPLPAIFSELPSLCFRNVSLSNDPRTLELVHYAAQNMENVQTLRIIHGHYNLTQRLLYEFFSPVRRRTPRHVWLESCSVGGFPGATQPGFLEPPGSGNIAIESLRLRRLQRMEGSAQYRYARAGIITPLHNGIGSTYETTIEHGPAPDQVGNSDKAVTWLNEQTYAGIPEISTFFVDKPKPGDVAPVFDTRLPPWSGALFLTSPKHSLRSLNLDWMLSDNKSPKASEEQYVNFGRLAKLVFPNLRAFQLRNAVTSDTKLSMGIWLLHPEEEAFTYPPPRDDKLGVDMLSFMENHPNLECLAWPMDRFYHHLRGASKEEQEIKDRAAAVVANLGRTLTTLRVDSYYTSRGEVQTDEGGDVEARATRVRRRLFITEFAAHMTKLTQMKVEGGIPRDEKRELIRAVHRCPLEKLVMIGVSCPLGNTWGANGEDLSAIDEGHLQFHGLLEPEHEEALTESTKTALETVPPNFRFRPEYGWPPGPPLLHTIAMYHSSTITELKFCGYNGSPVLHRPTAITSTLLHHLRHFHNLRRFITSFWLLTFFDFDWREPEIIEYWVDQRDPNSTALIALPEPPLAPPAPVAPVAPVATDTEGDTPMADANDGNTLVNTLSALISGAPSDDVTLDAMMAAALGVGIMGTTSQDNENTVVPQAPPLPPPPANTTPPAAPAIDASVPPMPALDTNPWEVALHKYFTPSALARGVFDAVGPHLSPMATTRKGGVSIRASFCLGVESGDIFDLDLRVDGMGVVPGSWVGPREESENNRWWGKLEERQWFG